MKSPESVHIHLFPLLTFELSDLDFACVWVMTIALVGLEVEVRVWVSV